MSLSKEARRLSHITRQWQGRRLLSAHDVFKSFGAIKTMATSGGRGVIVSIHAH